MPFDKLPGANLNVGLLANYRPMSVPAPPVFPTYDLVTKSLDKILNALDPVERAKRELVLASIPLQKEKLEAERANLPLVKKHTELQLRMLEEQYNQLHQKGQFRNRVVKKNQELTSLIPDHDTPPAETAPTTDTRVIGSLGRQPTISDLQADPFKDVDLSLQTKGLE